MILGAQCMNFPQIYIQKTAACATDCRYKADLSTRDSRLSELQEKWFKQQLQGAPASSGPTGRAPATPLTAEQRDMQQALQWFRQLGWEVAEPEGEHPWIGCSAMLRRCWCYRE